MQDGLDVVVGVVRGGHVRAAKLAGNLHEAVVGACRAAELHAEALGLRGGLDVDPLADAADAHVGGQLDHEGGVGGGVGPQGVVDVGDAERIAPRRRLGQLGQQVQHGHAVGPAGDGQQHAPPAARATRRRSSRPAWPGEGRTDWAACGPSGRGPPPPAGREDSRRSAGRPRRNWDVAPMGDTVHGSLDEWSYNLHPSPSRRAEKAKTARITCPKSTEDAFRQPI